VEIAGDPASFPVRGLDGPLEEPLAIGLGAADPPRQAPRDRDQQDREPHERDDHHGSEGGEEFGSAVGDALRPLIGLEQQRGAVGGLDRRVDSNTSPKSRSNRFSVATRRTAPR